MSLLTDQEIVSIAERCGLLTFVSDAGYENDALWFDADCTDFARAIEAAVIEKIKAQGLVAFEYNGEPWFDGNNWHEQKELTKDRKVAEFKAYLGKPPVPLYQLPEGD